MSSYDPVYDAIVNHDKEDAPASDTTNSAPVPPPLLAKTENNHDSDTATEDLDESQPQSTVEEPIPVKPAEIIANDASASESPDKKQKDSLKHKLEPSPSKHTPSKKAKKGNNKGFTVISSARSRHLKKEDGQPFWRKDIQYEFLKSLFDNDVKAFSDPFSVSDDNVNMDDRQLDPEGKLSFAELYIKSIAHSSKCSKVLKDRLLNDMKMSIPTCMICLLVNVGRMNTTINFVPDMKSQLRTYHPIPSLQVNYDSAATGNDKSNDKQLQDTPRLKSILKACCDDTDEPNLLSQLEQVEKAPITTIVNIIFVLCNDEEAVSKKFFSDTPYSFFELFMNASYDPNDRAKLFLWLLYNYLETHLSDEEIAKNPFGPKPVLRTTTEEFDIDTPQEKQFGEKLYEQRVKYLADDTMDLKPIEKIEKKDDKKSKTEDINGHNNGISKVNDSRDVKSSSSSTTTTTATAPVPPPTPVYRQDIDVEKVVKIIKNLKRGKSKERVRRGQLKFENQQILKELSLDDDSSSNRLRLKNYKGDFAEYNSKFHNLFRLLKSDYAELSKNVIKDLKTKVTSEYTDEKDLTLKSFDVEL